MNKKKELLEKITALQTEYATIIKEEFPKRIKAFIDANPRFERYEWTQGTPSFNDGDICTFNCYYNDGDIELLEREDSNNTVTFSQWDMNDRNDKKVYHEDHPLALDIINSLMKILDDYREEDFAIIFDDDYGLKVIITREGIDTEDYDYE